MSIDWTDDTLRPLDEIAKLAFPGGGVDAGTLKRRARQGKLRVYRPGKSYLTTLPAIKAMLETCVVPMAKPPASSPSVPNALGLSELDLSNMALDSVLREIGDQVEREREERKRLKQEDAPNRRLRAKQRRSARAKARYAQKKQARIAAERDNPDKS